MPTRVRSFSKINLGLAVGPARRDGYHGLVTCYQTLAFHDIVSVEAQPAAVTEISLAADYPGVPCTASGNAERNTAFAMVSGALGRLGVSARVAIRIEKRLPVQGGLGAGSANAAAALLGLERELGRSLPPAERLLLAAEVGSDVPLFLLGGTVLGTDRGQVVHPLPGLPALPVVVAVPEVGVSTALAFRELDARFAYGMAAGPGLPTAQGLTHPAAHDRLEELSRVLASAWSFTGAGREPTGIAFRTSQGAQHGGDLAGNPLLALVHTGIENDFESVAFAQHPFLREIKQALWGEKPENSGAEAACALYASLAGSGSSLFGIYADSGAAEAAQQRVEALGTRAVVTAILPRPEYWQRMFA